MKKLFFLLILSISSSLHGVNEELLKALIEKDDKTFKEIVDTKPADVADPIPPDHSFFKNHDYRDLQYDGLTIFHVAVLERNVRALDLLLEAFPEYIDIQTVNGEKRETLLTYACNSNDWRTPVIVNLLLQHGANVNHSIIANRDDTGSLPLAFFRKNYAVVAMLLQKGALTRNISANDWERMLGSSILEGEIANTVCIVELILEHTPASEFNAVVKNMLNLFRADANSLIREQQNRINGFCSMLSSRNNDLEKEKQHALTILPDFIKEFKERCDTRYRNFETFRGLILDEVKIKGLKKSSHNIVDKLERQRIGGRLGREITLRTREKH